jgi:hypothetical protein
MLLLPDTMIKILSSGGGLRVNSSGKMPETLVSMAAAAAQGNARLEIRVDNALLPDAMVQIGRAGGGAVIFDVT